MTRAMNTTNDRLGPYVFAFAAGALALSTLGSSRKVEQNAREEDNRVRAEIADRLLDRLAILYRAPGARAQRFR